MSKIDVDEAIEEARARAAEWFRSLPTFPKRVNLGSVVGGKKPAVLSEGDCVMQFARFLNEVGLSWESIHHQLKASRWLFDTPHPAAGGTWAVDIAIIDSDAFLNAELPATTAGFQFDAFLEFKYLSDFWTQPSVNPYGQPKKGIAAVNDDAAKVGRYVQGGVCRSGYVIVFEECDSGFAADFAAATEADTGVRVRYVRDWQ